MLAINYILRYLARQRGRVFLTLAGISISISAIVFAYGIAGWVEFSSSRSLSQVVGDSTIWVVPGGGVKLDPQTGLIIPEGSLSEETVNIFHDTGIPFHK